MERETYRLRRHRHLLEHQAGHTVDDDKAEPVQGSPIREKDICAGRIEGEPVDIGDLTSVQPIGADDQIRCRIEL